ncbi:MAG TPA: flagellar hook-basal body complex protein FliE [Longimicrobiaceae bacterium]|nr:flagellar hook-basal body complex protein FliE [Longimicrobiaceae bacterium]
MIDPIRTAALRFAQASVPQSPLTTTGTGAAGTGGASFGDTLKKALEEVSIVQETSQNTIQAFLRGEPVELHEVMAATEEAGLALDVLVEIRNKLTDAYRTIINMQS